MTNGTGDHGGGAENREAKKKEEPRKGSGTASESKETPPSQKSK